MRQPLRIAVWHNLSSGGAKRVLHDQVRGLVAGGHYVEAWCPPTADQSFLPLSSLIKEHVVPLRQSGCDPDRLTLRELANDRRDDITAMDEHCRDCAAQIEGQGFDVLLVHSCRYFATTAIGRLTRLPSVLVAEPYRELYEACPANAWAAPWRRRHWWVPGRRLLTAATDALHVQSMRIQVREEIANAHGFDRLLSYSVYARESIRRCYGMKATVCYPGIDTDAFSMLGHDREPFVMSLGAVCPDKNLDFVVAALALLPEPRPPLVWVGDQVEEDYLRQVADVAQVRGVELQVRRLVDHATLIDLLNKATLMVYAPRLEPLGLAALEAAACGLPVVAVAEAGIRETVVHGRTGIMTPRAVDAFAEAIGDLYGKPGQATAMGLAARDHVVQNWSMAPAIQRLEAQLAEVADTARTSGKG
jgi:glycosyltransferase involved in cell wall biosynthesis